MTLTFPNLSHAQVENASFIPKTPDGLYVPGPACNNDMGVCRAPALTRAVAFLQERVDKQEHRIQQLEEKLEKNNIKEYADDIVKGVLHVVEASVSQLNPNRDSENFRLRQRLNKMARENRTLVSNLHLALRRGNFPVGPNNPTQAQQIDCLSFVDFDQPLKASPALMDTNTVDTRLAVSSDLMDFDIPPTATNGEAPGAVNGGPTKEESVGILLDDVGSIPNNSEPYSKAPPASLNPTKPVQVSNPQPATPARPANKVDHPSRPSHRQSDSIASLSAKRIAPAPEPWDGLIKWKTTKVFNNFGEEMAAFRTSFRPPGGTCADQSFFQHGLVFSPDDDEDDVYRTVAITGIPGQVNLANVLKPVCGGPLYSVQLLRTIHLTGSHTAVITFLYEEDARKFIQSVSMKDVVYSGNLAKVSLVRTPTFPIPKNIKHLIFERGHTRCLSISRLPETFLVTDLLKVLLAWNKVYASLLEGIQLMDSGATVHIRFNCIKAAGLAMSGLKQHRDYENCVIKFVRDPCDRPALEEELI